MKRQALISLFGKMILLPLIIGWISVADVLACEVLIKVKGVQKESYNIGDEVIFEVTVFLTHHDCPEGIQATKFEGEGLELLGATKWKEISTDTYVRLIKTRVAAADNGEGILRARRKCDKEGGFGSIQVTIPRDGDEEHP
jgi:hypothetical protein